MLLLLYREEPVWMLLLMMMRMPICRLAAVYCSRYYLGETASNPWT